MAEDFVTALVAALDRENPQQQEAEEQLVSIRGESPGDFFVESLNALKSESTPILGKKMAMVLVTGMFPEEPEDGNENLEQFPEELITELLNLTFSLFGNEDEVLASIACGLYARISLQDLHSTDHFQTLQPLIQSLQEQATSAFLASAAKAIGEICEFSRLDEEESGLMLSATIEHIKAGDVPVKQQALVILRKIIQFIDEVLTDDDNSQMILQIMLEALNTDELKLLAYDCWIEIVSCYYPLLENYIEELLAITVADLSIDNQEIVTKCVMFWEELVNCENVKDNTMGIIANIAGDLLPLLFSLASACPFAEISDETEIEFWTIAANVLQVSVYAATEEAFPILVALASENMESTEYGQREASLIVIGSIIEASNEKRNPSEIIPDAVNIINERLEDEAPRVRLNALLCLHTLLLNILERGDECAFASLIPQLSPFITQMSVKVLAMLEEDTDLMATAVLAAVDFIRFPNFPHVGTALSLMYTLALEGDALISMNAFSALGTAIDNVQSDILTTIFSAIVDLLKAAIENQSDSYFVEQICHLLQKMFFRLKGQIDASVENCWNLISTAYGMDETISNSFLIPIASLGRASSPQLFQPYFPTTIEFIVACINEPDSRAVANAALSISLLTDTYDLSSFLEVLIPPMIAVLQQEGIEVIAKRYIADVVKDLARSIPEPFSTALEAIMPILIEVSDSLSDYQDELSDNQKDDDLWENYEALLISFLQCFKQTVLVAETAQNPIGQPIGEAIVDLLETACGLEYHREPLLREIVLTIGFLIEKFPEQTRVFFDDEPGFQECLKMALDGKIELEALQKIFTFLGAEEQE